MVRRTLNAAGLAAILTILTILSPFLLLIPTRQTSVLVGQQKRERKGRKEREGKARLNAMSERLALRTHTAAAAAVLLSRPSIPSATTIPVTGRERERENRIEPGNTLPSSFPSLEKTKNQPTNFCCFCWKVIILVRPEQTH